MLEHNTTTDGEKLLAEVESLQQIANTVFLTAEQRLLLTQRDQRGVFWNESLLNTELVQQDQNSKGQV